MAVDVESFTVLEPTSGGFRNDISAEYTTLVEKLLLDRANLLTRTAPEMTVLVGGMRVMNSNSGQSELGVFTEWPETLIHEFIANLARQRSSPVLVPALSRSMAETNMAGLPGSGSRFLKLHSSSTATDYITQPGLL